MGTPVWGLVGPIGFAGIILLLLVILIVTPAKISKIPSDAPDAETEIGGGLLVEYSGRNLAMFYLMDSVKILVMASLIVALFFPYNISNMIGLEAGSILAYSADVIFYLIKILIIIVFSVALIRVAVARFKIDQNVYSYWVPLTLMALVGLICIMWDGIIMNEWGIPRVIEMLGFV